MLGHVTYQPSLSLPHLVPSTSDYEHQYGAFVGRE